MDRKSDFTFSEHYTLLYSNNHYRINSGALIRITDDICRDIYYVALGRMAYIREVYLQDFQFSTHFIYSKTFSLFAQSYITKILFLDEITPPYIFADF